MDSAQIHPKMPVVGSRSDAFAVVDHLEDADTIKLTRDAGGVHHYIPTAWVAWIDDQVHIDRPGEQAMREWSTTPPHAPDLKKTDPFIK